MDDYNVSNLHESKNEYYNYLLNALTPLIMEGFKSIFNETVKICNENQEPRKYLNKFQKSLGMIHLWNEKTIGEETKRIKKKSTYKSLEELISCVHIIQTKLLTMSRVGQKQKKIDIPFPSLEKFIHEIYIESARSFFTKLFLFKIYEDGNELKKLPNIVIQEKYYEIEKIIQHCILNVIRKSIPIETIVSAYLDETEEEGVEEEIKKEIIVSEPRREKEEKMEEKEIREPEPRIEFNDIELTKDENGDESIKLVIPEKEEEKEEVNLDLDLDEKLTEMDLSDFTTDEVFELPDL